MTDHPRADGRRSDAGSSDCIGVLDVGGSHATAAHVDPAAGAQAAVVDSERAELDPSLSADALLDAFAAPALRLSARIAEAGGDRPDHWVVTMPGPFDYEGGIGIFGEVGKFDALRDVSVRAGLASRIRVDERRIAFVNDAVAYAVGEWAFGSETRADRHVCLTLGTGVGSAFLDRGRVVDQGSDVPPHGWAYLLSFDGRPLEDTVSTRAITRRFAERTGLSWTVKQIAEAARDGDAAATAVLDHSMFALGSTLAPWLVSFGATRLTVGGSMARSWPVLVGALTDGLADGGITSGLEVLPSLLLDDAPVLGAAVWLSSQDSSPNLTWRDQR